MTESLLTKDELLNAVKGTQIGSADCVFNDVQTDSRNVVSGNHCMFVPLIGESQNGHRYIMDVLEKKASVVLLNNSEYEGNSVYYEKIAADNSSVCFIRVENTLHALQDAAEAYVTKKCGNMPANTTSFTRSCGTTAKTATSCGCWAPPAFLTTTAATPWRA